MKLYKTDTDKELFYYFNAKKEKMYMYRHRYYDDLGKRREKSKQGFKSENAAHRALLEVRTKTLSGDIRNIENENLTVSQWMDVWFDAHKREWKVSTIEQRNNAIELHIKRLIGKYKLSTLNKSTYLRAFINPLFKEKRSTHSILTYHSIFKTAVNAAVDEEILSRNRFTKIKIEHDQTVDNFFTPKELNIFLYWSNRVNNITERMCILILAYTGMRRGEALALRWESVDFKEKTITITNTRDKKGYRSAKTKTSVRTIHIDNIVVDSLSKYRTWCMATKMANGVKFDKMLDYILISHADAQPITESSIYSSFDRIYRNIKRENERLKSEGLEEIKIKKITPHGLRHTHATILINDKVPTPTIAQRLGNTIKVLHETYVHSFEEIEKESVQTFSNALKSVSEGGFGGGF